MITEEFWTAQVHVCKCVIMHLHTQPHHHRSSLLLCLFGFIFKPYPPPLLTSLNQWKERHYFDDEDEGDEADSDDEKDEKDEDEDDLQTVCVTQRLTNTERRFLTLVICKWEKKIYIRSISLSICFQCMFCLEWVATVCITQKINWISGAQLVGPV